MKLPEEFKQWLEERHLKECGQCQREGKAKLQDYNVMAYVLFENFYLTKYGEK